MPRLSPETLPDVLALAERMGVWFTARRYKVPQWAVRDLVEGRDLPAVLEDLCPAPTPAPVPAAPKPAPRPYGGPFAIPDLMYTNGLSVYAGRKSVVLRPAPEPEPLPADPAADSDRAPLALPSRTARMHQVKLPRPAPADLPAPPAPTLPYGTPDRPARFTRAEERQVLEVITRREPISRSRMLPWLGGMRLATLDAVLAHLVQHAGVGLHDGHYHVRTP